VRKAGIQIARINFFFQTVTHTKHKTEYRDPRDLYEVIVGRTECCVGQETKTAPYDAEYASFGAKILDVFDVVEEA
jgi:hypothetical protein